MQPNARLLIAICTFNEMENLPTLVEALRKKFVAATILIVDDNSPDGTGDWCDQKSSTDDQFKVLHREGKLGLGSATLAAFQYAIETEYDLILTLDGDWSHLPDDALRVVARVTENSDVDLCIGSRYVNGGRIVGWPLGRRLMSFCINLYARWMIGLAVRDCSSAFRCYRIGLLSKLDLSAIRGTGYAYLEELLWHAKCQQARVVEAPITFTNRRRGKSKINLSEAIRAVWIIFKIACGRLFGRKPPTG